MPRRGLTRRGLFAGGAAGAAGVALGVGGTAVVADEDASASGQRPVPFHGRHQAGIATAAQDRLHFAAFDLTTTDRAAVIVLLQAWTRAAQRMTQGKPVGDVNDVALAPPDDTGEADGLAAARLTVTFGFGPGLFDGRFGLARKRPAALRALPGLPGDELDPDRVGGDLCVQACADDPVVAFHAVRNLARIARGTAVMRWSQLGFGRTSSTTRTQQTERNLMGFKDGTNNLKAEDRAAFAEHVWTGGAGTPDWLDGGSYLVARRIRMLIETWDRASLQDQERTIGRTKAAGAPLGKAREFDAVDLSATGEDGLPVVPATAHVRLAAPEVNGGTSILRRGYSFTDGMDDFGQLDAGLFFIAFMRDPQAFVTLQTRLGASDGLNEYIKHVGSAVFAVPRGVRRGEFVGQSLFA